jgi:hypothetical protein
MKWKALIYPVSPSNLSATLACLLKKIRHGNMSNQELSGTNHPNCKSPIDQVSPTNIGTHATSPLKKQKMHAADCASAQHTVAPCDATNLKSRKDLKLVSSNNRLK